MDTQKREIGERIARTAITMLAGIGVLYLAEIFQIAGRIQAATAAIYQEDAAPPVRRPSR